MNKVIKFAMIFIAVGLTSITMAADQEIFSAQNKGFSSDYCPIDYSCNSREIAETLINKCYSKGYRDCVVISATKTEKHGKDIFCGRTLSTTCFATVRGTR